ncbi:hypothetical protein [Sorangium sp. So ce124]|uniref:hypothetical protein n=1 Tax=Sorangium sp. So ce124 TaxID=3133280 RepID=UPI003F60F38B
MRLRELLHDEAGAVEDLEEGSALDPNDEVAVSGRCRLETTLRSPRPEETCANVKR